MPRPDFFIVGAPKCGTTALYTYLKRHPQVFMPDLKEPRYFAKDLDSGSPRDGYVVVRSLDKYLELFEPGIGAKRVGEASVLYMYSREAAREIRTFAPEARIIVMLRDPVDVMHAWHEQRLYTGNEDIQSFEDALAAEEDRRNGLRLPPNGTISAALQYRELVRFAEQLERYLDVFGRERVHVILYEDFRNDTESEFRRVLDFLDLEPMDEDAFPVVNASRRFRSPKLKRVVRNPPGWLLRTVRAVLPQRVRTPLVQAFIRASTSRDRRAPMDPALRRRLRAELSAEVDTLEGLLGRDLSAWKADA